MDLEAAERLGVPVVRVPEYSPHAVALALSLVRHLPRAYLRVREGNFSLDGLVGFDLYGKVVGVVGTGKIGACAARTFRGFGCSVLAYDVPGIRRSRRRGAATWSWRSCCAGRTSSPCTCR